MAKQLVLLWCCAMLVACSKPSVSERVLLEVQAVQGDAFAQCLLGAMYASGKGVAKDNAKAFEWFQKAAVQGDARAQSALGCMYFNGAGVPKDRAKAVEWLQRASDQGNAFAQRQLGMMYAVYNDSPKDGIRAYAWFDLASASGDAKAAKARDIIDKNLTSEQRVDAQKLSAELFWEVHTN